MGSIMQTPPPSPPPIAKKEGGRIEVRGGSRAPCLPGIRRAQVFFAFASRSEDGLSSQEIERRRKREGETFFHKSPTCLIITHANNIIFLSLLPFSLSLSPLPP